MTTELEIESFYHMKDFLATLLCAKFEQLNIDLFRQTLVLVQQVLNNAKLTTKAIDEIHKIPMDMFSGKRPSHGINPYEAVTIGAVISGGMLSRKDSLASMSLDNVCPFTIGIETTGRIFTPFIHCNSLVPVSHTKILLTLEDNQETVLIQVYEGEHDQTEHNTLIGEFEMTGIPPAACGAVQVEVKFELDANGILFVGAKEKFMGNTKLITISSQRSGLSEEELNHIILQSDGHFGVNSEDEFGEKETTTDDGHEKSTLEGMGSSMTSLNRVESEGRSILTLTIEQITVLHTEKMCQLEGLVTNLEECIRDERHVDALTKTSTNLMAIEVAVHEIQFWRMENSFSASLAELDNVIHTLVKLDWLV
ncbi:ATPase with role in protein import into the ER [Ceratobasidium sp. 423]|nr:ATPase with role in protein import into the ER [Ceratobasidium sp. 423]